jgi:hypothetical protein
MIKALAAVAASGLLLLNAAPASATDLEYFTGQQLYADCSAKPGDADGSMHSSRCLGYVLGVSDVQQAAQGAGGPQRVCLPATVGAPALVTVVTGFLQAHVDKRPLAAEDLVIEALSAAYPCK